MGLISNLFYLIDFFPIYPSLQLTFRNRESYSNKVSQFTSLLIFSLSALSLYYFGYNMVNRINPTNVVSEYYQSYPEYLNITKENSFFCFGLRNSSFTNFIDERVYNVNVTVNSQAKNGTKSVTNVRIKACSEEDLPENPSVRRYFTENPVINQYCIADYGPIDLEGSPDNSFMKTFKINLNLCENSSLNNFSCRPDSEIKTILRDSFFYLGLTNYAVDPMNYTDPFLQIGSFYSSVLDPDMKVLTTITFQHIEIFTDEGYILEDIYMKKGLNKLSDRTFYLLRDNEPFLQETTIELDKLVKRYSRKYDKIQDVLAKTGGVLKIFMILALIITRPLVRIGFFQDLCNEIFDYKTRNSKEKSLRISFWQYLRSLIGCVDPSLREKNQVLGATQRIIKENLNIANILNKLLELEKLKYIFFTDEQLNLFQYIPKPLAYWPNLSGGKENKPLKITVWEDVFMNGNKFKSNPTRLSESTNFPLTEASKAWEAYQALKEKDVQSPIDIKLLNCFGFQARVKKRLSVTGNIIALKEEKNVFLRHLMKVRKIIKICFRKLQ